ncbi:hypothetical protein C5167_001569 [Papaver somniferum]|uniref:50S ribosomal protein 5, chloroplastic n=1 Tax=Papaver somniferum TaxID=3469 RepID=A0A4Y7KX37_PAPSO|nr:50S ribosomal protein 5, chloroplastic-like [Papaver somniferum]RZC77357.1 hypothetical protein C5167_001569 [Papaver somniferum]
MRAKMALQYLSFSPSLSSVSSSSSSSLLPMATPISRLQRKGLDLQQKRFGGVRICMDFRSQERGSVVVKAASEIDGVASGSSEPEAETKEEVVPKEEGASVENLPLESKLQLKLEAKLRMKLAKKIRLKRKRLVQKRHLRKKGRWPPSKMKKNQNI